MIGIGVDVVDLGIETYWGKRVELNDLQPIQLPVMGKFKDELVDDAVNAEASADQLCLGIGGIVEDEVVPVEVSKRFTTNSAGKLGISVSFQVQP